jgi:GTPase SAR1 family protein
MVFGQLVVGPPGCGKSTYCHGLSQFYTGVERPFAIINLDPANDLIPYTADVDIAELIKLETVMEKFGLGPNGGLIYCMEYLETNIDWLVEKISKLKNKYLIFDCPGQVELFTNHQSLKRIIERLSKMDVRLCVVHLVDAHYCIDPSRYVSMLMVSLKTMLQFECPHINVLSKIDLMESYGTLGKAC